MTEEEIIALFYSPKKILHDCAYFPNSTRGYNIVTTDSQIENVHFTLNTFSGSDVAYRLFHVNLSDVCTQLGRPNWCVLNLGLPRKLIPAMIQFVQDFAAELKRQCEKYACELIGGDTFRIESQIITSLTMSGTTNRKLSRTCPSHIKTAEIYVSGDLGKAHCGHILSDLKSSEKDKQIPKVKDTNPRLENLPKKVKAKCINKYIRPSARYDLCQSLEKNIGEEHLYALIDISDGLYTDAHRMATANSGTFIIDLDTLPIDHNLKPFVRLEQVICSGEELELLILGSSALSKMSPVHLTKIGTFQYEKQTTTNQKKVLFHKNNIPVELPDLSFYHFYSD